MKKKFSFKLTSSFAKRFQMIIYVITDFNLIFKDKTSFNPWSSLKS